MDSNSFQFVNNSLTSNFILPEDKRPNLSKVSSLSVIPIIDLHDQSSQVVDKISKACSEYGFFQVINHGVPEELCERMMSTINDFFALPPEERAQFTSTDQSNPVRLFSYFLNVGDEEKIKMWSETFFYSLRPIHDIIHLLPENPPQFRDVVGEYGEEVERLMRRLLGLLSEGLGLPQDCLVNRIGPNHTVRGQANYYPPCPDPDLTLGLNVHTDFNALTVVLQSKDVSGLQVIIDGNWVAVDPVPNAFVVNIGDQLQVLSNGKFTSVHHRAVTNKTQPRISYVMFYGPNVDTVIGPIDELIDEEHPCLYRSYRFQEFLQEFRRQEGTRRMVKEVFELPLN